MIKKSGKQGCMPLEVKTETDHLLAFNVTAQVQSLGLVSRFQ